MKSCQHAASIVAIDTRIPSYSPSRLKYVLHTVSCLFSTLKRAYESLLAHSDHHYCKQVV